MSCKLVANKGGTIAGNTRKAIEQETGKSVISDLNAKKLLQNIRQKELDNKHLE